MRRLIEQKSCFQATEPCSTLGEAAASPEQGTGRGRGKAAPEARHGERHPPCLQAETRMAGPRSAGAGHGGHGALQSCLPRGPLRALHIEGKKGTRDQTFERSQLRFSTRCLLSKVARGARARPDCARIWHKSSISFHCFRQPHLTWKTHCGNNFLPGSED